MRGICSHEEARGVRVRAKVLPFPPLQAFWRWPLPPREWRADGRIAGQ